MSGFDHIFHSPRQRAQFATYSLSAGLVLAVAEVFVSFWQLSRLSNGVVPGEDELTLADSAEVLVRLATPGVYIITIILFLMWFHRVSRNLKPLGVCDQQHSPGWAVGSWFVPFANLFVPYRIAREIWLKSDNDANEYGFLNTESTVPGFMSLWWGFWIISNIFQNAASQLSFRASSSEMLSMEEWLIILANGLSIVTTIFVLRVIKDITARQEISAARIPNYGAPPPPPIYDSNVH